jgi:DNA-binding GntR family transcriptional regulator
MTRSSLVDSVYRSLKNSIISLEAPPGTPLREAEVAEAHGASRTPVREALRRLQAEGLVTIVPGRGAAVASLSVSEVLDAYEIRELLEPYAVVQAVRKGIDPARARSLLERVKRRYDDPQTLEEIAENNVIDTEFHMLIAEASGNELLAKVLLDMRHRMERVLAHIGGGGRFRAASEEHQAILEAMLRGDGREAAEIMRVHLQNSKARMLDIPPR